MQMKYHYLPARMSLDIAAFKAFGRGTSDFVPRINELSVCPSWGIGPFLTLSCIFFSSHRMPIASFSQISVVQIAMGPLPGTKRLSLKFGFNVYRCTPSISVPTVPPFSNIQEKASPIKPLDLGAGGGIAGRVGFVRRIRLAITTSVNNRSPTTISSSSDIGRCREEK